MKTKLAKTALAIIVAMFAAMFAVGAGSAFAATGSTPPHTKNITDNQDGTYTISLDIVGESEKKPNNVNVIVVFDRSGSMANPNNSNQRLNAAKTAVNNLANSLFAYNTSDAPNTVQMALVSFSTNASITRQPTNNYQQFSSSVNGLTASGGTNWEAALAEAESVDFNDDDQTFVIFVSDGNPTFRDTRITTDYLPRDDNPRWSNQDWNTYRGDNYYYNSQGVYGLGSDNANASNYSPTSMQRCYDAALPYAQAIVEAVGADHFYTIGAYGDVSRMQTLTTEAGAPASNFYNANDTAALNQAMADILAKIETMGFADAEVDDGTTNQVETTSGDIAELLELVPNFKYYRSGGTYGSMQEWSGAPEAKIVDGEVVWDLSDEGVLENGVRYTVTFDCYPSQTTYDTIAQLKNGDITYDSLDSEIKKYIVDNGNGSYSLRTNKDAGIKWDDTRDDAGQQESSYVNPDPVKTDAETLKASKEWEGGDPDVDSLEITILMDEKPFTSDTISAANEWSTESFISIGIIKDGEVLKGAEGHDFKFAELGDEQYHWELESPVVHPMLIDGTRTMLIMVDENHEAPSGAETYTIKGKTYYADSETATLTAINHRRSNLNLTKVVTGEDAPEHAKFPFELTVINSKAPESAPAGDTDHESDYWVWLSVRDENGQGVTGLSMGSDVVEDGGGYYYAPSRTTFSLEIEDGWSLRFLNLPTGSTYTFAEGTLPEGFAFNKSELTQGEDSTFSGAQTTTGTIENTKTSYSVKYTNDYALTDLEITKVWEDNDDQDGMRLTADELKAKLTLDPAVEGAEPTVKDNGDGTYTITYKGLPRFSNGEEVTYKVTESEIDGYTTKGSPAEDHGTITNTHEPEVVKVTITKEWDDSDNIGNIRPASIQAQLKANGENEGDAVTLNSGNEWTYTWEDLPKYKAGEEITYTADETEVPAGYEKSGPEKSTDDEGNITFTVTNTYNPTPVSVDPPVQKIIEGTDDLYNKGNFTFTIENTEAPEGVEAPMPAKTSITDTAENELQGKKGFYEFGEIEFTVPGTYKYVVKESGSAPGVTNDPSGAEGKTLTFTVTDDGTGKLVVSPTTDEVSLSFTNVYNAEGEATIVVTKAIEGADWPEGKTLKLTLEGADGAPMPETTTAELTAAGDASFGPIKYELSDKGKTYTYTITEDGFGDGWTADPAKITATVEVTDNGQGELETTITYDPETPTITNTYKAEGEATLEATKAIQGADWPEGKTLTLTLTGDGAPMPAEGGETVELTKAGKATFGTIAYTEADAGKTYNYTISEDGFGDGWTASPESITATVEVTDNGDGTLSTNVTYSPEDQTITNTYASEGEAVLEVTKALEGAEWPEGKTLKFTLSGEGGTLPETTEKELTAAGKVTYDAIKYTEADAGKTYTYTIEEDGFGDGWTAVPAKKVTATVEVVDNGDGTIDTNITYDPTDATITNTYKAEGEITLAASKTLEVEGGDNAPDVSGKYTLTLTDPDGNVIDSKANPDGEGTAVDFKTIKYTEADAGKTFTYTVTESGSVEGVTNGTESYTVTVAVTDNGDGTLSAEITEGDQTTNFVNTYNVEPTKLELKAGKKLEVKDPANNPPDVSGKYTLSIKADSPSDAPLPATTEIQNADGDGTVTSFGEIEYTAPGDYQYTISESGEVDGVTNGTESYTVKVTVTDNGNGTLTAEVTEGEQETVFTNTYSVEPVELEKGFEVNKKLTGTKLAAGAFEFKVTGDKPLPDPATASNDADGKVEFSKIKYDEPGTYTYTISEVNAGKGGYTYDNHEVAVTVEVTDNGKGNLEAEVSYEGSQDFTNTYKADGSWDPSVKKVLKGRSLKADEFTFELLDEDGKVIETKTNSESGAVQFSTIKYDESIFDDEESSDEGNESSGGGGAAKKADKADAADEAADDKAADEAAEDEGAADEAAAEDDEAEGEAAEDEGAADEAAAEDEAADEAASDEAAADEAADDKAETEEAADEGADKPIVFKLVETATAAEDDIAKMFADEPNEASDEAADESADEASDEAAADEAAADEATDEGADEAADEAAAEDDEADDSKVKTAADEKRTKTFKYTIREVAGDLGGVTYDTHEVAITVKVTDNGEGKLETDISYDGETTFINTYKAEGEVAFDGTKTVTGTELEDGQFSFQLKDSKNKVLQTVKNGADGSFAFDAIKYDEGDAGKTFTYQITEVNDGKAGYTYDSHECTVTVKVKDNEDGTLTCTAELSDGDKASFNNPYKPLAVSVKLKADKTLTGRALKSGEFEFELTNEDGEVVKTATNNASGEVNFGSLTFKKEGTYTFTATEVEGDDKNIEYDTSSHEYTVEVTDEDGQLVAEVSCDGGEIAEFENTYTPPKKPVPPTKQIVPPTKILPPTGDNLPIMLLLGIALAAAAAVVVAARRAMLVKSTSAKGAHAARTTKSVHKRTKR